MPTLADTLRGRDLTFLRMTADLWGLEISAPDAGAFLPLLTEAIRSHPFHEDVLEALPPEARLALQDLAAQSGRIAWPLFTRRYGEVRPFGAGRRDKLRPDLHPASPAEWLWYRGLIGRAFLKDSGSQAMEYAFLPEEVTAWVQPLDAAADDPAGRPATPAEAAHPLPATDRILDQAASLLAWLRMGLPLAQFDASSGPAERDFLYALLREAHLINSDGAPMTDEVRQFLEAPRGEALRDLAKTWREARYLNELQLIPALICEGDWYIDPREARKALLDWIARTPAGRWWHLGGFLRALRERQPDFLRPAGDYDSWFIRDRRSGEFLRGFESWDQVDGALADYVLRGPLHWLGMVDLAAPAAAAEPGAYRLSAWAEELLSGSVPPGLPAEDGHLHLTSAGKVTVPRYFPRAARYQIARLCAWEGEKNGEFRYRVTPSALRRAGEQGLRPHHLAALLRRHSEDAQVPPALLQALERWEASGTQAALENVLLLRLGNPEILPALRKTSAARFIEEELNPTLALLTPGSAGKVLDALAGLGYLSEARLEGERNLPDDQS